MREAECLGLQRLRHSTTRQVGTALLGRKLRSGSTWSTAAQPGSVRHSMLGNCLLAIMISVWAGRLGKYSSRSQLSSDSNRS